MPLQGNHHHYGDKGEEYFGKVVINRILNGLLEGSCLHENRFWFRKRFQFVDMHDDMAKGVLQGRWHAGCNDANRYFALVHELVV